MMGIRYWLIGCLLVAVPTKPLLAWSEGGHHLIAAIAFKMLKTEEQALLIEILKSHPQFDKEFRVPDRIQGPLETKMWLAGRAAYWPDIARGSKEYHRATWHYQLGSSLVIGDASAQKVPSSPKGLPESATLAPQELYILQAIELNRRVLSDATQPPGERALAISWLGHLVADAHQPCHAGSLYVEAIFPEGDRGGNSIPTKQRKNLHALWDGLLGERFNATDQRRRESEMERDEKLIEIGKLAVEGKGRLNPEEWLKESRLAAASDVYRSEVMNVVLDAAASGSTSVGTIDLSEEYLKNAGKVSQQRAMAAAYRLKEVWSESLRLKP